MRSAASVGAVALSLLSGCVLGGCGGCHGSDPAPAASSAAAGAPHAPLAAPTLGSVAPWRFTPAHGRPGYALPAGCRLRAPASVADVSTSSRFVAATGVLGGLLIVDSEGDPPRVTGAAIVDLLQPEAAPQATPWPEPELAPRIARSPGGAWLAAYRASPTEVALFRAGVAEVIARGDRIDAVDFGCGAGEHGEQCSLLTSRAERVWVPGADLWTGRPGDPPSSWVRRTIGSATANGAPVALASVVPPIAALLEDRELVFRGAAGAAEGASASEPIARLPAPERTVYAAIAQPTPMALVGTVPVDERGCSTLGAGLSLEVHGKPATALPALAPPISAQITRLRDGYLVTYLALTDCEADRAVAYGVLLDAQGATRLGPVALSDAESYAVSASGDEVDLWLQSAGVVTWLRARCAIQIQGGAEGR